jgi:hypothetical protein
MHDGMASFDQGRFLLGFWAPQAADGTGTEHAGWGTKSVFGQSNEISSGQERQRMQPSIRWSAH